MMRALVPIAAAVMVAGCSMSTDVQAVRMEIVKFHRLLNAGQFELLYKRAGPELTGDMDKEAWIALCETVRGRFGKFKEAKETGWFDNWNNGAHLIEINLTATYERGSTEEQFVYRMAGKKLILAGYHATWDPSAGVAPPPVMFTNASSAGNSSE